MNSEDSLQCPHCGGAIPELAGSVLESRQEV